MPPQTKFASIRPVLGVKSYKEAVEFYVDWLGFNIEWEWREAPGGLAIMQIARDSVAIQLMEGDEYPPNTRFQILVDDIVGFEQELNSRRHQLVKLADNYPYVRQISMSDPFGNLLVFEQPVTPEEKRALEERAEKMRAYIKKHLKAQHAYPTPEQIAEALFPPATFSTKVQASDVLFEFPEYVQSKSAD